VSKPRDRAAGVVVGEAMLVRVFDRRRVNFAESRLGTIRNTNVTNDTNVDE